MTSHEAFIDPAALLHDSSHIGNYFETILTPNQCIA